MRRFCSCKFILNRALVDGYRGRGEVLRNPPPKKSEANVTGLSAQEAAEVKKEAERLRKKHTDAILYIRKQAPQAPQTAENQDEVAGGGDQLEGWTTGLEGADHQTMMLSDLAEPTDEADNYASKIQRSEEELLEVMRISPNTGAYRLDLQDPTAEDQELGI
ncbi:hypothetical protein QBC41DRAFT_298626 [Cercophora samala]|uniref:Uncharacterized protein n=1 Tax=Cercophora samala TaxID=330535 RepID=A0AA40DFR4_9PEZI|nr:hypothetical protein QBC41DRAFT_298626 [Cercophora samala]